MAESQRWEAALEAVSGGCFKWEQPKWVTIFQDEIPRKNPSSPRRDSERKGPFAKW